MNRPYRFMLMAAVLCVASGSRAFAATVPLIIRASLDTSVTEDSSDAGTADSAEDHTTPGATAPDSARIVWVRFALRHLDDVRIDTRGGKIQVRHPRVTAEGLVIGDEPVDLWNSSLIPTPRTRLVPWGEIHSIQGRTGANRAGVVLGTTVGLVIGLVIDLSWSLQHLFGPSPKNSGLPTVLGVLGGASFGALTNQPGPLETVYP